MPKRSGFTLLEAAAVIIIIGILMGLVIPAIQRGKDGARRTQCLTHQKNFALASMQINNVHGRLPTWVSSHGPYQPPKPVVSQPKIDKSLSFDLPHEKIGTWAVELLLYLDAYSTYEIWTESRHAVVRREAAGAVTYNPLAAPNLYFFQCPSSPTAHAELASNSYIANVGFAFPPKRNLSDAVLVTRPDKTVVPITFAESMSATYSAMANGWSAKNKAGVTDPNGKPITLDDFSDGQSQTILFSESLQAQPWHQVGFANPSHFVIEPHSELTYVNESRFAQGLAWHSTDGSTAALAINEAPKGQDIFSVKMTPANAATLARPSSAHIDGVNIALADGSARFLSETIDLKVLAALLTPAGSDADQQLMPNE